MWSEWIMLLRLERADADCENDCRLDSALCVISSDGGLLLLLATACCLSLPYTGALLLGSSERRDCDVCDDDA